VDARAAGERIEALASEVSALPDFRAREKVEELVRLVLDFHGEGLARILGLLAEGGADEALFSKLASDELVGSLLVLHGLHPVPVEERIARALDSVRPYLARHDGGVTFLGLTPEGVLRLRLHGSCHGCASSTLTMKQSVTRAVLDAAPEVTRIEVEGEAAPVAGLPLLPTLGAMPQLDCPVPVAASPR
jgi:Fe-S cluster biogenesis protein NfuA